jgi:lipooligosaccharide transport system permease protein
VGELIWSLLRAAVYAVMFVGVMAALGLTGSWWTCWRRWQRSLIGYAFAGAGMALPTWMRSWQDFTSSPSPCCRCSCSSATFFPLDRYTRGGQVLVQWNRCTTGLPLPFPHARGAEARRCCGR